MAGSPRIASRPIGTAATQVTDTIVGESMRIRNEAMRNEVILKKQNNDLIKRIKEQGDEIQNLRGHLRELFAANEEKIVQ